MYICCGGVLSLGGIAFARARILGGGCKGLRGRDRRGVCVYNVLSQDVEPHTTFKKISRLTTTVYIIILFIIILYQIHFRHISSILHTRSSSVRYPRSSRSLFSVPKTYSIIFSLSGATRAHVSAATCTRTPLSRRRRRPHTRRCTQQAFDPPSPPPYTLTARKRRYTRVHLTPFV